MIFLFSISSGGKTRRSLIYSCILGRFLLQLERDWKFFLDTWTVVRWNAVDWITSRCVKDLGQ